MKINNTLLDFRCRLCDGTLTCKFTNKILGNYEVDFFECRECQSLQSEPPYWLDEAYKFNLSNLDTGAAQRNLDNFVAVYTIAKILSLENIVDVGGGDGLLCRLLRDHELNCYVVDKYAKPTYAQGYLAPNCFSAQMVVAFEVLEHYADPRNEIRQIFERDPKALIATTAIYSRQTKDWWYLAPESGQHVFFYSRKALQMIANLYGFEFMISGGFLIFLKKDIFSSARKKMLHFFLGKNISRLVRAILFNREAAGVWKDHLVQKDISRLGE